MKISKQARREARQLFQSCRVNGLLDENRVRNVVRALIAGKPRGYLAVLSHFQRLLRLEAQKRSVRVESPVPLAGPQQSALLEKLTRRYGPGLDVRFDQNPDLIGGLRVRVGFDVFDGTVRARLDQLERSL